MCFIPSGTSEEDPVTPDFPVDVLFVLSAFVLGLTAWFVDSLFNAVAAEVVPSEVEASELSLSALSSLDSSISSSDFLEIEFVFASCFSCLFIKGSSKKWKSLE